MTEGMIEATLLDRARPQTGDDRLVRLNSSADIEAAAPDRTLQQNNGAHPGVEAMHERAPRGGAQMAPFFRQTPTGQAKRIGLITAAPAPTTLDGM